MIRRDVTLPDGRPGWALISQVEHARIAAEVARAWNAEAFPLAVPHAELLAAVVHHDDGWLVWELRPTVLEGRPRDFMEMPLDESLAIWRRSIAVAQTFGPLAAYAVGSHFAALSRWSHEKAGHSDEWRHLAEEFIVEQEELAGERFAELLARAQCAVGPATGSGATLQVEVKRNADRAWHALQFFDRVSLWLCCAERREVETIDVPESLGAGLGAFRFTPQLGGGSASAAGEAEITIEPWPLSVDRLEIATSAEAVPLANYESPDALARAARQSVPLGWTLVKR
jgi:hypothetical protein